MRRNRRTAALISRRDKPALGTRSVEHMRENLAAETLSLDVTTLSQLNAMMTPDQVAGARYSEAQQADIDTEEF